LSWSFVLMVFEVPPPARGWSALALAVVVDGVGSPACAGMVLQAALTDDALIGFPRLRGDGPLL